MSTKKANAEEKNATTEDAPVTTHLKNGRAPDGAFTDVAGGVLHSIRGAKAHVPGVKYLTYAEVRALTSRYCIDPRFLEAACTAVEASPELARLTGLDTVKVRNAIRMDAAFAPVEQEAQSLSDAIHGARMTSYCEAVDSADAVLKAARGLMSTSAKEELGDHVARMSTARLQKRKTSDRPSKKKGTAAASAAADPATSDSAAGHGRRGGRRLRSQDDHGHDHDHVIALVVRPPLRALLRRGEGRRAEGASLCVGFPRFVSCARPPSPGNVRGPTNTDDSGKRHAE